MFWLAILNWRQQYIIFTVTYDSQISHHCLIVNILVRQVYTWGHRLVTPRRVVIARNLKKSGNTPWKSHRLERLHVAAIAAGMVHSLALTSDGTLFYWASADPDIRCEQVLFLKDLVSVDF